MDFAKFSFHSFRKEKTDAATCEEGITEAK